MPRGNIKAALEMALEDNPTKFSELMQDAIKIKTAEALEVKKQEVAQDLLSVLEAQAKGEKEFIDKHNIDKVDHPVAGENNFKGGGPARKKRKGDNVANEKEDPTSVSARLKKADLSGKSGG